MTILKCKMCGGNIQITGERYGICDSCGCEVTLPQIDDDKRALFYDRGNYFRQRGEFDKAYASFEHILADDLNDAEIYWCLVLCKYGIQYELDVRSGDYKPTISRMSFRSILEDSDYLKAMENSDEYTKSIYRREAEKIAGIQDKYLEIVKKESPYDVFICFKAEEENGERTVGSVIAQDIYEKLTEKGLKVFFSRITLLDKPGEQFEPYIFTALNSAKVMLLVSNNPKHLQAQWVKNEWSRYLKLMEQDRRKKIIPVYKEMNEYDFPQEIPIYEKVDASLNGYLQDLIRGVLKILGKQEIMRSGAQTINVQEFIDEAAKALKARNYSMASTMSEQALNFAPENAYAHYYALLAKNKVSKIGELMNVPNDWRNNAVLKRISEYGDEKLKYVVSQFLEEYCNRTDYSQAQKLIKEQEYQKALELLEGLGEYKDAREKAEYCRKEAYLKGVRWEYRLEVGLLTQACIDKKIKREHPREYEKYVGMLKQVPALPRAEISVKGCLISGILLAVIGLFQLVIPIAGWYQLEMFVSLAWLLAGIFYGGGVKQSTAWAIFVVSVPTVANWWYGGDYPFVPGVVRIAFAFIPMLQYSKLAKKENVYKKAVYELDSYENQMIRPLEQAIRDDLREKYEKVISEEEFNKLLGIREYMIFSEKITNRG